MIDTSKTCLVKLSFGTNSPLKIFRSFIINALSLINNWRPCDYFIPNSIHATSCRYFRWYGYTHVSLEKFIGWVYYLDMIDTSKKCLFKRSLAEWKSEIENRKSEFSIGFKRLATCIFNVLNLKPTNIGLNSSHKENKFKPRFDKTVVKHTLVLVHSTSNISCTQS